MFNFLNRFNGWSQIDWILKKHIICSSYAVIKSLIASFDFDIFEWKVEKIDAFLRKQVQKKLNFSSSIPNFEMDFYVMINPIMGKVSLNHILCHIQKSFAYSRNNLQFFSFFKLRQRMESHFKNLKRKYEVYPPPTGPPWWVQLHLLTSGKVNTQKILGSKKESFIL